MRSLTLHRDRWPDGRSSTKIATLCANFKLVLAQLESVALDSGAYLNEVSLYSELNWK